MDTSTAWRVSHLAAFARWKEDEESSVDWLIKYIRSDEPTEAMAKGTAFHKFLEESAEGTETFEARQDGCSFAFTGDFELYLPKMREWRREKDYGGIVVSGQVDAIEGKTIWDHKTTENFDAENYLTSWQHKFYLDLFGADRFVWNIWCMRELDYHAYEVYALHRLEQYRYPDLERDCRELAQEFKVFAERWL